MTLRGSNSRNRQHPGEGTAVETDAPDPGTVVEDLYLDEAMAYARRRDYAGWDYGDGMSSRLLQAVPVDNRILNLVVQETVKRFPLNLRPLFLVERRRNFMGAALFAMTNLTLHRFVEDGDGIPGGDVDFRGEARELLDWLVDQRAAGTSGYGVGHPHAIQDIQGVADPNEPDSVCTSFAVKAFLRGASLDDRYGAVAESAAEFVVEDLDYRPTEDGARITYSQNHTGEYYTLNAGALAARQFVDLYDHFGDEEYYTRAREMLDHIAARQQPVGGWLYRDPPEASHLSMDTHHNGFIIEAFQRYEAVTDDGRYEDVLDRALSFFVELFDDDGGPHFDETSRYPQDAHAAAQGILVFTYAGDLERARRIIDWTLDTLHAGDGRFYFRKYRLFTHRVTLMRWCQAWLSFAFAEYLRAARGESPIDAV